jgi:membrane fusion protein (multidrug efflux system)
MSNFKNALGSMHDSANKAPPGLRRGARRVLLGAISLVLVAIGWAKTSDHLEQQRREDELRKGPQVYVVPVRPTPAERVVQLNGEARPYASVTLYAKVSGYLKKVLVDKGDIVKKDQILAVIESPETDKAYQAAVADAKNKKSIAERIAKLFERNLVSQQERDQAVADSEVSSAHLESTEVLKSYEILRASFAGTIVARYADPGALVQNATNSQTSALPVVAISQVNELRVYVYLDQRDAPFVEKGSSVEVTLSERPDLKVEGHVARLSGELDEKTRMLLTEIDLDNSKGLILPGSLVNVRVHIKALPGLQVPVESLVLRDGKTLVPVVDPSNEVHFAEVQVGENDGKLVNIRSGLTGGQMVALNVGASVAEKGHVRPIIESTPAATAPALVPAATPTAAHL